MTPPSIPLEQVIETLDRVIRQSPADDTELVWVELVRAEVATGRRTVVPPHNQAVVTVRVRERGRWGEFQGGAGTAGELSGAVRQALGRARVDPPGSRPRRLAEPPEAVAIVDHLFDRELATLDPEAALEELNGHARRGEHARLAWTAGRVIFANSRGLAQRAAATAVTLAVRCGRRPGAGRAAASARHWRAAGGLDPAAVFERARERDAGGGGGGVETPGGPLTAVLSAEAAGCLIGALAHHALTTTSFKEGTSFLADRLDQRVLDSAFTLRDDATAEAGLPFPFDLCGFAKRPVTLIERGTFHTPAVDDELAELLDRPPTPHAVALDESRPEHLFLGCGELTPQELLDRGELWLGGLERLEVLDPRQGAFRALVRNVRRIEGGRLGAAVPDLTWRDHLPRLFDQLAGLGRETVTLAGPGGFNGGITAPAMAVAGIESMEPR